MYFTISNARCSLFTHFISFDSCSPVPLYCNILQFHPLYFLPPLLKFNKLSR